MLAVLVWLFGRVLEPLVVGLSLPLSIVGAMLGLLISRSDFGIISLIGLIFLLGLLDKNAILLIDYANQLRQAGLNRTEAILETGVVRLRPILMTTASTILGMLPIALGLGCGGRVAAADGGNDYRRTDYLFSAELDCCSHYLYAARRWVGKSV